MKNVHCTYFLMTQPSNVVMTIYSGVPNSVGGLNSMGWVLNLPFWEMRDPTCCIRLGGIYGPGNAAGVGGMGCK